VNKVRIYLVYRNLEDDGSEVIGAGATLQVAEKIRDKFYREIYQEQYDDMRNYPGEYPDMKSPEEISIDEIHEYLRHFDRECRIDSVILKGEDDAEI